jgi:hypothetical protein
MGSLIDLYSLASCVGRRDQELAVPDPGSLQVSTSPCPKSNLLF